MNQPRGTWRAAYRMQMTVAMHARGIAYDTVRDAGLHEVLTEFECLCCFLRCRHSASTLKRQTCQALKAPLRCIAFPRSSIACRSFRYEPALW